MPLLINQQPVSDDRWIRITEADALDAQLADPRPDTDLIVDWALYQTHAEPLNGRGGRLGIAIPNALDVTELASLLPQLALVAVDFPSFADGRAFSQARLLRRLGFAGQIRALGDVTWDRLRFMHRCGIDAMQISEARYSAGMTAAFDEISVRTQGCADDPKPIYRQPPSITGV